MTSSCDVWTAHDVINLQKRILLIKTSQERALFIHLYIKHPHNLLVWDGLSSSWVCSVSLYT